MIRLRGGSGSGPEVAGILTVRKESRGSYGSHRSKMMSPVEYITNIQFIIEKRNQYIRGRSGRFGNFSVTTDRGGAGRGGTITVVSTERIADGGSGGRSRRTSGGG